MLKTATNSLNISSRKPSLQRIAAITLDFIKKIPSPNRSQIIEKLQEQLGFSQIEAHQSLRHLEDSGEIFTLEDLFLKVVLHRDVTTYSQERSNLQQSWLKAREEGG